MKHRHDPDRGRRGFALIAALFVLAVGTALVARMAADGLAARRLAAANDPTIDAARADLALEALSRELLAPGGSPTRRSSVQQVDGVEVKLAWSLESGRIDLNFLPEPDLAAALAATGLGGNEAHTAAQAVASWRGDGGTDPRDGRMAFWSMGDIDRVPGLGEAARRALHRWGSVAARGPFIGVAALESEAVAGTAIGDGSGNGLMSGTLLRLSATTPAGRCRMRVVMAVPRDGRLVFRRILEDTQCS